MLLDATFEHVQALKKRGSLYLDVSPQTLKDLQKPVARITAAVPAPAPRSRSAVATPAFERAETGRNLEGAALSAPRAIAHLTPAPTERRPPEEEGPFNAATESTKETAMAALRARALSCLKCPNLVATRKNVVFGVGDIHSPVLFVGEAPGSDEDLKGEPFVGAAGLLLTKMIGAMGLTRETVYIANVLKCRPDMPPQAVGNRKPTSAEMQTCLPYLQEQISLIQPKVIVALGATAMEGLQGAAVYITKIRGRFQSYRGIPLMPTYHPAYLLRNSGLAEKRKVWEDMLEVMAKLEMPISEKQRGYFLRGA